MKRWMGYILIVIGLTLIAIPLYNDWKQQQDVRALEHALAQLESLGEGDELTFETEDVQLSKEELQDVIELEIPSIDLKQKILPTTTKATLDVALTQIKEEQQPGEGNFTVAGHRGYRDGRHFSNLNKVKPGDRVYIHTATTTYEYEIEESEVIPPTAVEVLNDHEEETEITLITCTVSGKERVAVKGVYVGSSPR